MSERIGANYSLLVGKLSARLLSSFVRSRSSRNRSSTASALVMPGRGASHRATAHDGDATDEKIWRWVKDVHHVDLASNTQLANCSQPTCEYSGPWRPLLPASVDDVDYIMHVDGGGPQPDADTRLDATDEFLVLDNSDLPLELFDNSVYETRSPSQWIALGRGVFVGDFEGTPASAPAYRNGRWTWEAVAVSSYDEANQRYTVTFADNGQTKQVKRLNLKFVAEPEQMFWERRQWCEQAREAAKAATRYKHYLSKQPGGVKHVAPLPVAWERRMVQWAVDATGSGADSAQVRMKLARHSAVLASMMEEVRGEYILAMKHATACYHTLNPRLRARFRRLKLPLPQRRGPAPMYGMVASTDAHDARQFSFQEVGVARMCVVLVLLVLVLLVLVLVVLVLVLVVLVLVLVLVLADAG